MNDLASVIKKLDEDKVFELVKGGLAAGRSPLDIIASSIRAVVGVCELHESGDYFVSQLMFAAKGLRDKVKVIIGGAPCNEEVRAYAGADY